MSNITNQDIKKLSRLARIEVLPKDYEGLTNQLNNIINWVEKLNEVNVEGVEPLTNVHNMTLNLNKDEVKDGNIAEDVLKNAKNAQYNYFTVPKVIE